MPTAQTKLAPDTSYPETIAILNDNIDKTVTDIGDLGAKFSSTSAVINATVAANGFFTLTVGVIDTKSQYRAGALQIVPRVEAWVDNQGDDTYLLAYGSNLTADQQLTIMTCWVARRPNAGRVAQFVIQIWNAGLIPHTYYIVADESYIASPPQGQFR